MNRAPQPYLLFIGFLLILVAVLVFERQLAAEQIRFLEKHGVMDSAYRNLRKGMTQEEVSHLISDPDEVYQMENDPDTVGMSWDDKDHVGSLHRFFGIEMFDAHSYMALHLNFDKNRRLISVYYGG